MDIETFQNLPTPDVAQLVRESGKKVCVFPVKGTRRWFTLEHPDVTRENYAAAYLSNVIKRHIELYQLIFAHGLDTLLTPSFDMPLMQRSEAYVKMAVEGLARLATHEDFLNFYHGHKVRVRFYGDYVQALSETSYAYLCDLFAQATEQTLEHTQHRLFFGLFVQDPTATITNLTVQYYKAHQQTPDKQTLIEMYYGESVGPVDIFIGFGKLRAFDMPLVATSTADLYFTVSPSLYLTQRQLRAILYDHLYSRRRSAADRSELSSENWATMRDFYRANLDRTLGIGKWRADWGTWQPIPQVQQLNNE